MYKLWKNSKYAPIFKDSLVGLKISDYDIETAVYTQITVEENPLVHNAVFKAVIEWIYKSEEEKEEEEEKKSESQEVGLADEIVVGNRTIEISTY